MSSPSYFRPKRPKIHCSIDVLFHLGALWLTRAVGLSRDAKVHSGRLA